jgi:hypothetical protein
LLNSRYQHDVAVSWIPHGANRFCEHRQRPAPQVEHIDVEAAVGAGAGDEPRQDAVGAATGALLPTMTCSFSMTAPLGSR